MPFRYLEGPYFDDASDGLQQSDVHAYPAFPLDFSAPAHGMQQLQVHIPDYLYDAPPTLAPGGGAEALHPAQAATWFANSGFRPHAEWDCGGGGAAQGYDAPVVQSAYASLAELASAFTPFGGAQAPAPPPPPLAAYSPAGVAAAPVPMPMAIPMSMHMHMPMPMHSLARALALSPSPPPLPAAAAAADSAGLGLGFPVYSQTGFDVIALLSRVAARRSPTVPLGPIDLSTSFVVADCRRHDDPIVYCSPSFLALTGYAEREVVGRNCRFLQAPPPPHAPLLARGAPRAHTHAGAVRALAKAVGARKEAQATLVNYRRDGRAFVNRVSVVPLVDEDGGDGVQGEVAWIVGFQVDLTAQSDGIMARVKEGSYYHGAGGQQQQQQQAQQQAERKQVEAALAKERRATAAAAPVISPVLARLLARPAFLASCGVPSPTAPGIGIQPDPSSHILHTLLLSALPDFVHVLSLKVCVHFRAPFAPPSAATLGACITALPSRPYPSPHHFSAGAFLYVAPAVTRVLGWAPSDLVGHALADVCFERDVVSVGRALKEASLPVDGARVDSAAEKGAVAAPRTPEAVRVVDLVFRARTKQGAWVWVECRGRLHVEPGKGRKAIVMIGRARGMAKVTHAHDAPALPPAPARGGSGSGLEFALQPKRARTAAPARQQPTLAQSRALVPAARRSGAYAPDPGTGTGTSAAVPTAFHGLIDPHGLLLSVGPGASAVLGWEPRALRGTRLGALEPHAPHAVDALLAGWRADRAPGAREARATLRGAHGPVAVVVRLVAPDAPAGPLPPLVAPAHLMYGVRAADAPAPAPRARGADVFARLDPATGESWPYELSQLRFANARLAEEIRELERAEAERAREERERAEKERAEKAREEEERRREYAREMAAYSPMRGRYGYEAYPVAYHLPIRKRPWDGRD
ncbi:hypothetical protein GGX14DRAFT_597005 [Mycena pura]|uniref:PAS domain-containing protein n=1 Tax=Mycena pura TaxID=153505 RepID=A0AAD6Y145_9AGAR|nr:hypothetical protein GGX14DRAFT_597005 [Mycena pura]